ncbi:MAG: hypothetical protein KKA22_00600 [Gammaproteobacteria bacterium]|nr:hypothetical protein [Gammaproteobacteria bacterium]MBU1406632.1 hypothetical protein [Gammaproteobacteria bacterium]MBU1530940.1 hypothetical protein [Gammaproteobacteria bacterium]
MTLTDLVTRIDQIIELGEQVLATRYTQGGLGGQTFAHVKSAPMAGFRAAALSFIDRVYGSDHSHFKQFLDRTKSSYAGDAERGLSILRAIRSEIAGGWLFTVKGLVAAELFSDFLDMAEHLLEQGFKDAAAVMIGSVLEEHLRQLCHRHSVDLNDEKDGQLVPRKADRLNAELAKKSVYTSIDQKQITAWLGLRNDAAHGKYGHYTAEQVKQLLSGVMGFMVRVAP